MPDSEIFKLVIQLGSFGLLAIIVAWVLRYGAPMLKQTVEEKDARFTASLAAIADAARAERTAMLAKFDTMLERQEARHEDEKKRRDAALDKMTAQLEHVAETMAGVTRVLGDATDRLGRVEARTDEFPTPQPRPRRPHSKNEEKAP